MITPTTEHNGANEFDGEEKLNPTQKRSRRPTTDATNKITPMPLPRTTAILSANGSSESCGWPKIGTCPLARSCVCAGMCSERILLWEFAMSGNVTHAGRNERCTEGTMKQNKSSNTGSREIDALHQHASSPDGVLTHPAFQYYLTR